MTKDEITSVKQHCEQAPHWSESIEWRAGRFDPMSNAPQEGYPILHIRGKLANGSFVEPMHYAYGGGGGEEQAPFRGWFIPCASGYVEVSPVGWQPLRASPGEVTAGTATIIKEHS